AAADAAAILRDALAERGSANLMLATGTSQLTFLARLIESVGSAVDWSRVTGFHMDEYVGIAPAHPASFQRYMRERVAARLPFGDFHYIDGAARDSDR